MSGVKSASKSVTSGAEGSLQKPACGIKTVVKAPDAGL
jgi:hypothetical protein